MKIHEYQAQALLKEFGVPVLDSTVVTTPLEAAAAARQVGFPAVLKAQVHAGGRGKAGGVRIVDSESAAERAAADIFKLTIKGLPVRKILVVPAAKIRSELYLSLLLDRSISRLVFIASAAGGMDIEETARTAPEKILRLELPGDRHTAAQPEQYTAFAHHLLVEPRFTAAGAAIMSSIERLFRTRDCALVEINPLVVTQDHALLALDAKILLDDNALFRQPGNAALRDPDSEDAGESEAREAGLSFIGLDGAIGCMVNGAGLAMATLDTIKHLGGEPANFLDVGGSSSPDKITAAFRIILRNPRVKVIFINIFGGITRCDDVARGLLAAMKECSIKVPLVVRLIGTNEAAGRELLAGQNMIVAGTLQEGAQKAVELARSV